MMLCFAGIAHSQELNQSSIDKYIKSINLSTSSDSDEIKQTEEIFTNNNKFIMDNDSDGNIAFVTQMIKSHDAIMLYISHCHSCI